MLSISARGSAVTAVAYYAHLSTGRSGEIEDYYAAEGQGRWAGSGASALGLEGDVQENEFISLARGFHPDKEPLTQNAGEASHRAGWDLTLSAPKSVSVAWALAANGLREAIEKAHTQSVDKALAYVERHASFSRRGKAGVMEEPAGLVASVFRHGTSRELDPQLHSHCFIHNVAVREDATTGTLQSRHFYIWQKAIGAAYRVELSSQLHALGYSLERDGESFRLAQIPKAAEREFSRRRLQIETVLSELGVSGARAAEKATLATRRAKTIHSATELRMAWQDRARTYEFGIEPALDPKYGKDNAEHISDDLIDWSNIRSRLTEQHSTFSEAQAAAAVLVETQGKPGLERGELYAQAFLARDPDVIRLEAGNEYAKGGTRFTTREMRSLEETLAEKSKQMTARTYHNVSEQALEAAIAEYPTLSEEQRKAVQYMTQDSGDIALVQGEAGTGKSYALGAGRNAWEKSGYRVYGIALSGKAAQELERGSGIQSTTIASFMGDRFSENNAGKLQRLAPRTEFDNLGLAVQLKSRDVVVLDEAGMVGSRQMNRLLASCEAAGAKVVLIGDTRQLQAIEAGAAFRVLQEHVKVVNLTQNRRQALQEDRDVIKLLRMGKSESALKNLAERNRLRIAESIHEAKQDMGHALAKDLACGKDALGITPTRQDAHDVNLVARESARDLGFLKGEEAAGITRYGERAFATGDRVIFGRNANSNRITEMGGPVNNGDRGTVVFAQSTPKCLQLTIKMDRGGERLVDLSRYDWIDHSYAITAHKAQGATIDRAHVLANETSMPTGREWSYVAASRHRESLCVYSDTTTVEELAPQWSRTHQKDSTLDYEATAECEQSARENVTLSHEATQ